MKYPERCTARYSCTSHSALNGWRRSRQLNLTPGAHQNVEPISRLRQRIVDVCWLQPNNAILTTFNEVNMQHDDLRARWKDRFAEKHGVAGLYVPSLLRPLPGRWRLPVVNASVDGNEIIWRDYWRYRYCGEQQPRPGSAWGTQCNHSW